MKYGCSTYQQLTANIRGSIVVSIPACHAGDPGSIPGSGVSIFFSFFFLLKESYDKTRLNTKCVMTWWYSVVVSISGCDPLDPGSNPGTAINFFFVYLR